MSTLKVTRPNTVIKSSITPLSTELKSKTSLAIQMVANKIKEKHLN